MSNIYNKNTIIDKNNKTNTKQTIKTNIKQ